MTKANRRNLLGVLTGLMVGVLVVGAVYFGISTYLLVSDTREQQQTNTETYDLIQSCVDPDGTCYQEGQRRTGDVVDDIGQLSVYASACAAGLDPDLVTGKRVQATEQCVEALVEAERSKSK